MELKNLVRKNILELEPYTSARSSHLSGILMDANENSFGSVVDNFIELELNRYPDPFHTELRSELSSYLSIPAENIFCGVGSDEIIDLLIRIFCEPQKDKAIILNPTYGMYKVSCNINNVETVGISLTEDFQIDVAATINSFDDSTKLIFCCSPNNPTGNLLRLNDIKSIAEKFNGIVVVDEAYIDFSENNSATGLVLTYENIVVIRTFSKAWGLAGLRLGYCIVSKEIINLLYKIKLPYNLNKVTTALAVKALRTKERKDEFVRLITSERTKLAGELSSFEKVKRIFPSDANFILFEVENAGDVYNELVKSGIIIRNRCKDVKDTLRVSVGTPQQNELFLTELRKVL
ncbi:MAG: histidinol-phosphate transaminase [bacterium]